MDAPNEARIAYFHCNDCGFHSEPFDKSAVDSHLAWHVEQNRHIAELEAALESHRLNAVWVNTQMDAMMPKLNAISTFVDRHVTSLDTVGKFINRYAQHLRTCDVVGVPLGTAQCNCQFVDRLQAIWKLIPELNVIED